MIVERSKYDRSVVVRTDTRALVASLSFRALNALIACQAGYGRTRWRCRYSWWLRDSYLEPECDAWGVGFGTLLDLRRNGLVEWVTDDEGPVTVTSLGEEVLAAVLADPAFTARTAA